MRNISKIYLLTIIMLHAIVVNNFYFDTYVHAGLLKKLEKISSKAAKTTKKISKTPNVNVNKTPSLSYRLLNGITITGAASVFFSQQAKASPTRLSLYMGKSSETAISVVSDKGKLWEFNQNDETFDDFLDGIITSEEITLNGNKIEGIDIFAEQDVIQNNAIMSSKKNDIQIILANLDGKAKKIKCIYVSNKKRLVVEISPTLFVKRSDNENFEYFEFLKESRFEKKDVKIISIFDENDDIDTLNYIKSNLKGINVQFKNANIKYFENIISSSPDKIIALIGHIEAGKYFVGRNPSGEILFKLDVDKLVQIAKDNGSTIVTLGCNSAEIKNTSGFSSKINSIEIAKQLKIALSAKNYEDFLSSLGTIGNPIIVHKSLPDHIEATVVTRSKNQYVSVANIDIGGKYAISANVDNMGKYVTSETRKISSLPEPIEDILFFFKELYYFMLLSFIVICALFILIMPRLFGKMIFLIPFKIISYLVIKLSVIFMKLKNNLVQ